MSNRKSAQNHLDKTISDANGEDSVGVAFIPNIGASLTGSVGAGVGLRQSLASQSSDRKGLAENSSMGLIHAMHNLSSAHVSCDSELSSGKEMSKEQEIRIGVLALQGAFSEHCIAIHKCGAKPIEIRQTKDLENIQGLVLPGGESTVMIKLLCEQGLLEPLKELCQQNIPILATCAGLILLAKEIKSHPDQARLGLMDIVVERNAFGRQKESFSSHIPIQIPVAFACAQGMQGTQTIEAMQMVENEAYLFPAIFIRAPQIFSVENNVRILAQQEDKILAVQQDNMVACSFHPELSSDLLFHKWLVKEAKNTLQRAH